MRAILVDQPGGPEVLRLGRIPRPNVGALSVLVRVRAAALNHADMLQRQGLFAPPPGESEVLGVEIAGDIVQAGPGFQSMIGRPVFGLVGGGGYAEYCLMDAGMTIEIPPGYTYAEAAALPEAYFTGNTALFELGELDQGMTVLIHGGGSGLGTACIQMAKHVGAHVTCTVRSAAKAERVRQLGADRVIQYPNEDFSDAILRDPPHDRMDVVLDIVGADYLERNLRVLRDGGRLLLIGILSGTKCEIDLDEVILKRLRLKGAIMRSLGIEEKQQITATFKRQWLPQLAHRTLRPVVDSVYPLGQASQAHARMRRSEHIGKIVLDVYCGDAIPVPLPRQS